MLSDSTFKRLKKSSKLNYFNLMYVCLETKNDYDWNGQRVKWRECHNDWQATDNNNHRK